MNATSPIVADAPSQPPQGYRGRIAPTPTGLMHLGHARTFWTACERANSQRGVLVFRNEDLDPDRCRAEFATAALVDLHWLGCRWLEGPDVGGSFAPYTQSQRLDWYREVWQRLAAVGAIYPSPHSRKDIASALLAPHDDAAGVSPRSATPATTALELPPADESSERIFPVRLRPPIEDQATTTEPGSMNWRFRVPDGQAITFQDGRCGAVTRTAGIDFGDFLVWRKDGFPSYELAVVADDHAMQITEVVRGEDLLTSTARQLLLYAALGWQPPNFFHCPLVRDAAGRRLAKRTDALSLRALRAGGMTPEAARGSW